MTLSQLCQRLERLQSSASSDDADLMKILIDQIRAWRADVRTPRELLAALRRGLGGIWLGERALHQQIHEALESFSETVAALGGMTMNERLVMFDLMERWDDGTAEDRNALYAKLEASAA